MKKLFIAIAVLLLLCGCEKGAEVPSEISETAVQTVTAAEVTATSETTVTTVETTTVTTTETTVPTGTTAEKKDGIVPKMPEAVLPAGTVEIDIDSLYEETNYDFSYMVLDEENILILYEFKKGGDVSAKAKIFGISDGEEKLTVNIPHTEADTFLIKDSTYFDDENILCRILSCKEERSYGYNYSTLLATTIYRDYKFKLKDDDIYGLRSHIHELSGGRKITVSDYGNIREVGSGNLLLNAVYDGPDSKSNVYYRYKFSIDENRFVYDMLGWEWIWGLGVYDFTTGEARDIPYTDEYSPLGYHNGKIYSYYDPYGGGSDNIIYVTDVNTLETKPLFQLDENDLVYCYDMTSDGRFLTNTEYSPKEHTFKVILYSPDTFEIVREYVIGNIFEEPCCTNLFDGGAVIVSGDEKYIYILDFNK